VGRAGSRLNTTLHKKGHSAWLSCFAKKEYNAPGIGDRRRVMKTFWMRLASDMDASYSCGRIVSIFNAICLQDTRNTKIAITNPLPLLHILQQSIMRGLSRDFL
jgi:hypothetical protein